MGRKAILFFTATCAFTLASCSKEEVVSEEWREGSGILEVSVTSVAETNASADEENIIRRLYIYAYDDSHAFPDYYCNTLVNNGNGANGTFRVEMAINGMGKKRFYMVANPPRYVEEMLTTICPEGTLKTLGMVITKPLENMGELPQEEDGSIIGDSGFPMANYMEAYVSLGEKDKELVLYPEDGKGGGRIVSIPLFRSLAKVSVSVWRENCADDEVVAVKRLSLYNYTLNGFIGPKWDISEDSPVWVGGDASSSTARWNPSLLMDLKEMVKRETRVGNDAVSVLDSPAIITPDHNTKETPQLISDFYLCQNSYGEAMTGETQSVIPDVEGNRTTRLVVELEDGRLSTIPLPYLLRNDHLKIRISVTDQKIKADFHKWELEEVSPDWDDGVWRPEEGDSVQPPAPTSSLKHFLKK